MRTRAILAAGCGATLDRPVHEQVETFTAAERERLAPHFTNLDRPVFALVNLPETVKGALFARYSRYPRHAAAPVPRRVRRLAARGDGRPTRATRASARRSSTSGSSSATATTRSPSSAARTWPASGLQRPYQDPPAPAPGRLPRAVDALHRLRRARWAKACGYRYYRDAELGPGYAAAMDFLFATYADALPRVMRVGRRAVPARRGRARGAPTRARSRPRRWTCCAACCPPARCRTWASTPPARPTSS